MKASRWSIRPLLCLLTLAATGLSHAATAQATEWKTLKASKVAEGTWQINDSGVNVYVVLGSEKALVIDTGNGGVNLLKFVREITQLPLVVVNTHGHPDHIGANDQFGAVFLNPADVAMYRFFTSPAARARSASTQQGQAIPDVEKAPVSAVGAELLPVSGGHVFELGNRRLEVIEVPGHTAGEIVLLDRQRKLLFTGDNSNGLVWLHLKDCRPLSVYLKSLEKLAAMKSDYETILPGHGEPISSDFISEQIACVKQILDGTALSKVYKSFAGDGRIAVFKRASVAYNPDNLRE